MDSRAVAWVALAVAVAGGIVALARILMVTSVDLPAVSQLDLPGISMLKWSQVILLSTALGLYGCALTLWVCHGLEIAEELILRARAFTALLPWPTLQQPQVGASFVATPFHVAAMLVGLGANRRLRRHGERQALRILTQLERARVAPKRSIVKFFQ